MNNIEALEKGKIINKALQIVNKLAENDLADFDSDGKITSDDFESDELKDLIIEARSLKSNPWWRKK
jgi:hypothetical protein